MKNRIFTLLLIAVALFIFSSCHKNDDDNVSKTFVLVHGAWQAPYAWQYVKTQLEQNGQKVVVVELPAHGSDNTPPQNVTMDVYRDKVADAINAVNGKVILVGHSMGGFVVSEVAEKIPSKIEKLVYIGAFVPANGQSLQDLAGTDAQSLLGPNLIPSSDQLTLDIKQESRINIFIQDGSDDVKKLVSDNFKVEPAIPFINPAVITSANFGSVDKYYIHTAQDHAIGPDLQVRMVKAAGITKEYSLNSSHCPFLSMPDNVTQLLLEISRK
ncbi:alpha/beta fold hydrolase [Chitinophagaceae bacterium MMS25-I14]